MSPPKSSVAKLPRLPPLKVFRVRRPNKPPENPCVAIMASMLTCWASTGFSVTGCASIETQLRACMDKPRPKAGNKSTINYHMNRLYPKIVGPRKPSK